MPSGNTIIEVPMSTVTVAGKTFPIAGGGYVRHFPYAVTKWAIKRIQKIRPAIVYMHPYSIDAEEIAFDINHLSAKERKKVRSFHKIQLRNRNSVPQKLLDLLSAFRFTSIAKVIDNCSF